MLRLHDVLADRFRVDSAIAEGGMGVVYRGVDLAHDSAPVAIKALRDGVVENATRFAREASILSSIDHPGIVRYVAHGVSDTGSPYLVMRWLDGTTLSDHATRVGLAPGEAIAIVRDVADALGAAHARGLVHRDVKPDNIVLVAGDIARPVVIDFGLARHAMLDSRLTATGTVVGTPGYMAPEQARGERVLDGRTDVFALGCVLYECLGGVPAFGGRNAAAILARIVLCEPPPLDVAWPTIPPSINLIIRRMMAKLRENRFADGAEVAAALAAIAIDDAPRRRRRGAEETATVVGRQPDDDSTAAHVVYVQGTLDGAALESVLDRYRARVEQMIDGVTVIVLAAEPDATARAAQCTLDLARAFPTATIALAGPAGAAGAAPLETLLDAGADALERADIDGIFGEVSRGVRVDAATAARLAGRYAIRVERGTHYLVATGTER
jgi:hypothetical protein